MMKWRIIFIFFNWSKIALKLHPALWIYIYYFSMNDLHYPSTNSIPQITLYIIHNQSQIRTNNSAVATKCEIRQLAQDRSWKKKQNIICLIESIKCLAKVIKYQTRQIYCYVLGSAHKPVNSYNSAQEARQHGYCMLLLSKISVESQKLTECHYENLQHWAIDQHLAIKWNENSQSDWTPPNRTPLIKLASSA